MGELVGYFKSFSFHFRWLFLSPQARYSWLWAKTKKLDDPEYTLIIKNTTVGMSK